MPFKPNTGGIYVWVQPEAKPTFTCTTIVKHDDGENIICGARFWTVDALTAHASKCAKKHQEEIQAAAPSNRLPDWLTGGSITDWETWMDQTDASGTTNRQKVIEGRLKL